MTHIYAALVLILLIAIGCGVRRILKHTGFVASTIAGMFPDESEDEAPIRVTAPGAAEEEDNTRPAGFGVRLRERN